MRSRRWDSADQDVAGAPGEVGPANFWGGSVAGSPDTVAAKIQELVDLGIIHMHLRFTGEWAGETRQTVKDSAELFAREVMPRFTV